MPSPYGPPPRDNPFGQLPSSQPWSPEAPDPGRYGGGRPPPASRFTRFIGRLIDSIFLSGPVQAVNVMNQMDSLDRSSAPEDNLLLMLAAFGWMFVAFCIQSYLITTQAQSLGKLLLGMRIVTSTGEPVSFIDGVLKRELLVGLFGCIPCVGVLVGLADALAIFRENNRCLHDEVADTYVVDA